MKIYNNIDQLIIDIDVDDSSYRHRVIKGDNNIVLKYSLPEHVEIPVGSYCQFQGQRYTLERPEAFKKQHNRRFDYTVTFESNQAKASIWKFRNPVDGRLKFSLTATPKEHLQMFVDNMNRRDTGWTVGECVSGTETLINYDHDFCIDALKRQATTFETEYEIEGKRVSLKKVEYNKNNPLPLAYGCGNGFKSGLGRSNSSDQPPTEILFVQGGSDNIDPSKYGNAELLLPKGQSIQFDGEKFENEDGFVPENARSYIVDDLGLSIRRTDKPLFSLAEDSLDASSIYPKRVGWISSVVPVDKDNNFYDFVDKDIPSNLDYEACLIEGETMTVIFQSGMLAGKEFEVKYYHNSVKGQAARRFEILPQEIDGVTMPNETFKPRQGDSYAVFHCMLPAAYIRDDETKTGGSWDMFRAAVRHLFDNEEQKYSFTGELDGLWAKKDWENIGGRIRLGGYVLFRDENFQQEGVLVRITGIKEYINNPHSPTIELSNQTVGDSVSSELKTLKSEEVTVEENYRAAVQFTKRRFRDAKETISMLESALLDNFTNSINPIAVQTMSMLVGDESLQFRFVNNTTSPSAIPDGIEYNNTTRQLTAPAGIIQHLTLGISSLSSEHKVGEYKFWRVQAYSSSYLDDGAKKYYLYIKANKTSQAAEFILSENARKMESEAGVYYFLVGVLNSEYNMERSFVPLYGFTEVLPGRITTDRIVSGNGDSYFDMLENRLKLGDALSFNADGTRKLILKGTLVQSESGDTEYIGCYRGVYNSSYTYYQGDEVSYTYNGITSTYRYIYATPARGVVPTSSTHWQVIAQGSKGQDGVNGTDGTSFSMKGSFAARFSTMADYRAASIVRGKYYLIDRNEEAEEGEQYAWTAYTSNKNLVGVGYKTTINKAEIGDAYLSDENGHLFIADDSGWVDVGQIKGDKGDKGDTGDDGADGNYTELRFAVNGSTTTPPALATTSLNPSGWSTTVPTVNKGYYLWFTRAVKTGNGAALISNWSTPVRMTPYDGKDGANGKSPVMVFRGQYNSSKTYYGNSNRLDCVKHGDTYYIARIDAGTFSSPAPPDTSKWNSFGASFESIATNLLLAEGANIGDWFISQGQIVSTLLSGNKILLDARNSRIRVESDYSGGSYSQENVGSVIDIDANQGIVEARAKDGYSAMSYMSPTGIFANRAGTQCVSATTGATQRASICGLGLGNLNKEAWQMGAEFNLIAGVYGNASNSGTAPYYGGYFHNLKANGISLNTKYITSSGTYLTDSISNVVGFGSSRLNVYLPASTREGQTIFVKQWWRGSLRVYPRSGQKIYDNTSQNEYYDFAEGQGGIFTFVRASINGENVEVWLVSRWKY